MGTTYHYSNLTKREWFSTDALGGSAKLSGLGLNLTARGFDLLLVRSDTTAESSAKVRVGRWAGDAVAIIGDTDDNWLRYSADFADLTADVILLIIAHDGFERVGAAAEDDNALFVQLCHLCVTRQAPALEPLMRQRFGARLWQRHKDLRHQTSFEPKDIARPGSS
jgi:hypothetical protein